MTQKLDLKIDKAAEDCLGLLKYQISYRMKFIAKLLYKNGWLPKKLTIYPLGEHKWAYHNSLNKHYATTFKVKKYWNKNEWGLWAWVIDLYEGDDIAWGLICKFKWYDDIEQKITNENVIEKFIKKQRQIDGETEIIFKHWPKRENANKWEGK